MVGMSGKTSEPRRGASSQHKKPSPTAKAQPSAEALHVAKILGDKYPSDLSDKIAQVTSVVPSRSEEEVCIALHDHDFDPAKAISALLDSDSQDGSQVCLLTHLPFNPQPCYGWFSHRVSSGPQQDGRAGKVEVGRGHQT